jgi:tetratricopeptide (TPR) repeat protein
VLIASLTGDLQGLTPLIAIVLTAIGVWYFRQEIKNVVGRLTKIEATRKDTTVTATMSEDVVEPPGDASGTPAEEGADSSTPEPEAEAVSSLAEIDDVDELRSQMIRAYMAGEEDKGNQVFDRLTSVDTDPVELRRDQIIKRASGFIGGVDPDGLTALEERADDPDLGYLVYRMIGACHSAGDKPLEAADAYQRSVELSESFDDKVTAATLRAGVLEKVGSSDQALGEISQLLTDAPDNRSAQESLWLALADLYKALGKPLLYAAALHRVAQLAGNNARKWFRAGYAYSETNEANMGILVVHCYVTCLSFDSDHQYAKNNLGAYMSDHGMPISAAEYYEKAAQLGNTLAMGNMAQNYLNAGFADDAAKMVERAEKHDEPHEKVADVKGSIASRRSDETEKFQDLSNAGSRAGQFLTRYVAASGQPRAELSDQWALRGLDVELEVSNDTVIVTWSEGSYRGGRRFKGVRSGRAITGVFESEGSSFLADDPSWTKDGSGYGVVAADGRRIEFLRLTDDTASYLELSARDTQGS